MATDRRAIVKVHEKLLPYAILWGVEKEWARELEVVYRAAVGRLAVVVAAGGR